MAKDFPVDNTPSQAWNDTGPAFVPKVVPMAPAQQGTARGGFLQVVKPPPQGLGS